MKFGKLLEEEAIPEWRPKFIKYELLKKKLREISLSLQKQQRTNVTGSADLFNLSTEINPPSSLGHPLMKDQITDPEQLKRASLFREYDSEGKRKCSWMNFYYF
jgi:hypothetical protein